MNFFQNQHKARHKTWVLVVYFLLAVVLIMLAVNLAIFAVFYLTSSKHPGQTYGLADWFSTPYAVWVSLGTFAVIAIGSMNTFAKLRGGGRAVAELVGARKIDHNTSDIQERRLINVVEEMSIASGTPVPEL